MSPEVFYPIYYFQLAINILLFMVNILVFVFLCFQWKQPKSVFNTSYFYILNGFYFIELFFTVCFVYARHIQYDNTCPFLPVLLLVQWYCQATQGIWEFTLGFSRMTAMAFPSLHEKLWGGKRWIFFFVFVYAFPFISNGYVFQRFDCKFQSSNAEGCLQFRIDTNNRLAIMTMALNVLCLVLIMIGLSLSPKHAQNSQRARMERRLTIQTVISAASLLALYAQNFFTFIPSFTDGYDYRVASYTFWMLQYYPSMLIIFFITPTIKAEFFAFYFSWFHRITPSNNTLQISSVSPFSS